MLNSLKPLKDLEVFIFQIGLIVIIALLEGQGDDYPETSFYMVGNLNQAFEQGTRLAAEAEHKKS